MHLFLCPYNLCLYNTGQWVAALVNCPLEGVEGAPALAGWHSNFTNAHLEGKTISSGRRLDDLVERLCGKVMDHFFHQEVVKSSGFMTHPHRTKKYWALAEGATAIPSSSVALHTNRQLAAVASSSKTGVVHHVVLPHTPWSCCMCEQGQKGALCVHQVRVIMTLRDCDAMEAIKLMSTRKASSSDRHTAATPAAAAATPTGGVTVQQNPLCDLDFRMEMKAMWRSGAALLSSSGWPAARSQQWARSAQAIAAAVVVANQPPTGVLSGHGVSPLEAPQARGDCLQHASVEDAGGAGRASSSAVRGSDSLDAMLRALPLYPSQVTAALPPACSQAWSSCGWVELVHHPPCCWHDCQ